MLPLAAPAPRAAPCALPQQFVSLKAFCPQRPQGWRAKPGRLPPPPAAAAAAAAAAAEQLLRGARPLVLPAVPLPEDGQLPPFHEWHRHPELLTG